MVCIRAWSNAQYNRQKHDTHGKNDVVWNMPLHSAPSTSWQLSCAVSLERGSKQGLSVCADPVIAPLHLRPIAWTAADPQSLATADTWHPSDLKFCQVPIGFPWYRLQCKRVLSDNI